MTARLLSEHFKWLLFFVLYELSSAELVRRMKSSYRCWCVWQSMVAVATAANAGQGAVLITCNFIMFNQSGRFTVHFRKQDRIRKLLPIKDILLSVAHSIAEPWILLVFIDFSVCYCIRPIQFESFITNGYHSIHVHVQCPSYSAE